MDVICGYILVASDTKIWNQAFWLWLIKVATMAVHSYLTMVIAINCWKDKAKVNVNKEIYINIEILFSLMNTQKIHRLQDAEKKRKKKKKRKARSLSHRILVKQIWSSNLQGRQRCDSLYKKKKKKEKRKRKKKCSKSVSKIYKQCIYSNGISS